MRYGALGPGAFLVSRVLAGPWQDWPPPEFLGLLARALARGVVGIDETILRGRFRRQGRAFIRSRHRGAQSGYCLDDGSCADVPKLCHCATC
jgi:hypothetical protein